MKRTYAGIIVLSLLLFLPATAFANKVIGSFAVVKGKVSVKDKKGTLSSAKVGGKVKESDTIIAEKDSRAKLVMIDQNQLNISPESEISLDKYTFEPEKNEKSVLINVLYGKVRSEVNQKYDGKENTFHVKTPAAVAGVRGTDFLAGFNASSKQSQFVTFKGLVEVGQSGPGNTIINAVSVAPGQATTAIAGSPPAAPSAMPKSELAKIDNESNSDKSAAKSDVREPADSGEKKDKEEKKEKKEDKADKKEERRAAREEAKREAAGSASSEGGTVVTGEAPAVGDAPAIGDSADAVTSIDETTAAPLPGEPLRDPATATQPTDYVNTDSTALPPPPPIFESTPTLDPLMPALPPPLPTAYIPPPCDYCNAVITSGKTTLIIDVTNGAP